MISKVRLTPLVALTALLVWCLLALPGWSQSAEELYQSGLRQLIRTSFERVDDTAIRSQFERSFALRPSGKAAYYLAWLARKSNQSEAALAWSRRALLLNPRSFHNGELFLALRDQDYRPDPEESRCLRIYAASRRHWEQFLARFSSPLIEATVKPAELVCSPHLLGSRAGPAEPPPGRGPYRFAVRGGKVELRREERLIWSFQPPQQEPARLFLFPYRVLVATPGRGYWLERGSGRLIASWPAEVGGTVVRWHPYEEVARVQGAGRRRVAVQQGDNYAFLRLEDGGGWANYVPWHYASMWSPEEDQVFGTRPVGTLEARAAASGALHWRTELETPRLLACGRRELWVLQVDSCTLHCFDRRSGRRLWSLDHNQQLPSGFPR